MQLHHISQPHNDMMKDNIPVSISSVKNVFFCGIGGIGMSGLAIFAKDNGLNVSGSDISLNNPNLARLFRYSIAVYSEHNASNVRYSDLVVYSSAIDITTNAEILWALHNNIPVISRAQFLSILMENYYNFVISGSHGKTTTTAITAHIINQLYNDVNAIVGGVMIEFESNIKFGKCKEMVVESDESDGSFINMPVNIGVVNNIDSEHLNFYNTFEKLKDYFFIFAKKAIEKDGLVLGIDNFSCKQLLSRLQSCATYNRNKIITCGFEEVADVSPINLRYQNNGMIFDVIDRKANKLYNDLFLPMFGEHNLINALMASYAVGFYTKYDVADVLKTLPSFQGVEKRFSIVGKMNGAPIVDDYAHNPQKILAAAASARHYLEMNNTVKGKLFIIFEPHRYTRVRDSIDEFVQSLKMADVILVMDIYTASEELINGINKDLIVNKLKLAGCQNVLQCQNSVDDIHAILNEYHLHQNDIVLFVGAGTSSYFAKALSKKTYEK